VEDDLACSVCLPRGRGCFPCLSRDSCCLSCAAKEALLMIQSVKPPKA